MKHEMPCSCACCRAAAERRAATKAKLDAAQTRLDAAAVVLDAAQTRLIAAVVVLDAAQVAMDDLWSLLDEVQHATPEGDDPQDNGNDPVQAFLTRQATPDWN